MGARTKTSGGGRGFCSCVWVGGGRGAIKRLPAMRVRLQGCGRVRVPVGCEQDSQAVGRVRAHTKEKTAEKNSGAELFTRFFSPRSMFPVSISLARWAAAAPPAATAAAVTTSLVRSLASSGKQASEGAGTQAGEEAPKPAKKKKQQGKGTTGTTCPPAAESAAPRPAATVAPPAVGGAPPGVEELGGPRGPEPTRFGEWCEG